jgi:hypothetical protein
MKTNTGKRRNKQRGVAMIVAMLALLLLSAIGVAFMFMSDAENSVNNNYKDSQKAYFGSRAGLENVRVLLAQGGNLYNQASALTAPAAAANTGVIYVTNSTGGGDVIDPTTAAGTDPVANPTLDDELCHERFAALGKGAGTAGAPCGANSNELMTNSSYFKLPSTTLTQTQVPNTGTASALPFKWVRITNKQNLMGLLSQTVDGTATNVQPGLQVCWDGQKEVAIPAGTACGTANPTQPMNPVWMLTSLAVTPAIGLNQGSRRMTQMEVSFNPPVLPDATITTEAPITIQGNLQVNGYDNCNCTAAGANRSGMTCNKNPHAITTHSTIGQNGNAATITAGPNPPTKQNLNPWPYDVNALINNYVQNGAVDATGAPYNVSCSGTPNLSATPAVYASCGTVTGTAFGTFPGGLPDSSAGSVPQVTYIPGSVRLSGNDTGSGILIIDGDLDVHGGLAFYGLILVRGRIAFTGGGSQNVNLYGSILAGEDVNVQDVAISDVIGGSFNFQYDSCALRQPTTNGPPKLLAEHEIMY